MVKKINYSQKKKSGSYPTNYYISTAPVILYRILYSTSTTVFKNFGFLEQFSDKVIHIF